MYAEKFRWLLPVLLVTVAVNGLVYRNASEVKAGIFRQAGTEAHVAAEIVLQRSEALLGSVDSLLSGLAEVVAARRGLAPGSDLYLHRLLVRRHAMSQGVTWFFLVRPDGNIAELSSDFPAPVLNVAERPYFHLQRDHWDQGLYLGPPLVAKRSGRPFIPVSRRVENDGGLFQGVVAAGLDPVVFEQLMQSQSLPEGYRAAIFLADGQALACFPRRDDCLTRAWAAAPLFSHWLKQSAQGDLRGSGLLDGEVSVVGSYMAASAYPIRVAVEVPEALLASQWAVRRNQFLVLGLASNLTILVLAWFAARQLRRRQEALSDLAAANAELEERVRERTRQLALSETRARAFMNTAMDAVVVVDGASRIVEFNRAAERMFLYRADEVIGQSLGILMPESQAGLHTERVARTDNEQARAMGREVMGRRRDGGLFPIEVSVGSFDEAEHRLHVGIIRDITERKHVEWNLQRLATTDSLTGILNRRACMEQGEPLFDLARRHGWPLVVMVLDADRFKSVNDTYGHHVGDEVLKLLTASTAGILRSTDIFGRLGGEEFGLILPETDPEGAEQLGLRILETIRACRLPLEGGGELSFTISIGATCIGADDTSLEDGFKRADACLYAAKHGGRDRLVLDGRVIGAATPA